MSDVDPNYVDPNLIVEEDNDFDDDDDFVDEVGADGNRVVGARAVAVAEHVTRSLAEDRSAWTRDPGAAPAGAPRGQRRRREGQDRHRRVTARE